MTTKTATSKKRIETADDDLFADLEQELLTAEATPKPPKRKVAKKTKRKKTDDDDENDDNADDNDDNDDDFNDGSKSSHVPLKKRYVEQSKKSTTVTNDDEDEHDGFDDDLLGDDEDRARMAQLPELERERIFAERYEARQQMEDRRQARLAAKLATGGGDSTTTTAAGLRGTTRRARGATQQKKQAKSSALDDLRRRHQIRESGELESGEEENNDDEDEDEEDEQEDDDDDDDENDAENEKKSKIKSRLNDHLQQRAADDVDDTDTTNAARRRKTNNGMQIDDDDDQTLEPGTEQFIARQRECFTALTVEVVRTIQLRRFQIEKWLYEPFFEKLAIGCFVRVSMNSQAVQYRVGRVASVRPTDKDAHSAIISVKIGDVSKDFESQYISNHDPKATELEYYKRQTTSRDIALPTMKEVEKIRAKFKEAETYIHRESDVEQMLLHKAKLAARDSVLFDMDAHSQSSADGKESTTLTSGPDLLALRANPVTHKAAVQRRVVDAEAAGDVALVQRLTFELERLDEETRVRTVERKVKKDTPVVANINERNRLNNFKRSVLATANSQEQAGKSAKPGESGDNDVNFNAFARRKTQSEVIVAARRRKPEELPLQQPGTTAAAHAASVPKPDATVVAVKAPVATAAASTTSEIESSESNTDQLFRAHRMVDIEIEVARNPTIPMPSATTSATSSGGPIRAFAPTTFSATIPTMTSSTTTTLTMMPKQDNGATRVSLNDYLAKKRF